MPASSGKTTRHRLSRGGDRNANQPSIRWSWSGWHRAKEPKNTWQNAPRRARANGKIMRCLKPSPGNLPSDHQPQSGARQLRPAPNPHHTRRHHQHRSSRTRPMALENFAPGTGTLCNDTLAATYRQWLTEQSLNPAPKVLV
ncbi:hypothetical protein [Arthrobacter sp. OAP107]|uniref:hypothetical protein n=1 Tax=Arthrobacter sp. OAP107 TaxID=3156445 RepID=UPI003390B0C4